MLTEGNRPNPFNEENITTCSNSAAASWAACVCFSICWGLSTLASGSKNFLEHGAAFCGDPGCISAGHSMQGWGPHEGT